MERIRCVVERITYQNAQTGYSVIRCRAKGYNDLITAVGCMPETHVGSVLEMYVYKACRDAGVFDDVCLSAIVNWDGDRVHADSVTNEIDVACTRGVMPLFISCKTCAIRIMEFLLV